jgi:hypothetical protein
MMNIKEAAEDLRCRRRVPIIMIHFKVNDVTQAALEVEETVDEV